MRGEGSIRRWDAARGFGFIQTAERRDVFFHVRDFRGAGAPTEGLRVSFEAIEVGGKGPRAMDVRPLSATAGPARRNVDDYREAKSDAELIARLRNLQGTPEEALANEELLRLTLPILRADFLVAGSYAYRRREPLQAPIHVLGGKADELRVDELLDWQDETATGFSLDLFEGHHFFLQQQEAAVLRTLKRYAEQHLLRLRARTSRQVPLAAG